jgi:hypothetical protein
LEHVKPFPRIGQKITKRQFEHKRNSHVYDCSKPWPSFCFFSLRLPVSLSLALCAAAHGIYAVRLTDSRSSRAHRPSDSRCLFHQSRQRYPVSTRRTAFLRGWGERGRQRPIPLQPTTKRLTNFRTFLLLPECSSNSAETDRLFTDKCASH